MIVLVTGLMRSGTSIAAEMLHRAGCPMGTAMEMPATSGSRVEWEDIEFTREIMSPLSDSWLKGYAKRRESHGHRWCRSQGLAERWGVKSPLAALHMDKIRKVWGEDLVTVRTSAWSEDALDRGIQFACSFKDQNVKTLFLKEFMRLQDEIQTALDEQEFDHVLPDPIELEHVMRVLKE